jgi:hypothetical protein
MDRRLFLKSAGLTAGAISSGGLLAACGDDDVVGGIPEGRNPTLNVLAASYETLTGEARRFAFGVADFENVPVKDRDLQVYLTDLQGEVLSGPHSTEFFDEGGPGTGVYIVTLDLTTAGPVIIVAVDGEDFGQAAINVVRPEDSQLLVPGDQAVSVATPTVDDDLGVAEICTQEPDCGMHDVSLDDALAQGLPIVLLFATPKFCVTAVCAPAVATIDQVRESGDWGDVAFIHAEIFSDEGETLMDAVIRWELPTEPWLFTIGPDGTVVDRRDGPMVGSEVARMVEELGAA